MKSIFAASSILFLSIASFFTQSDMNISFDSPTKVIAGESFVLNVNINKGDISNFAKLQLNLPTGFSAELLEGKGGTFTFYDQKMKLIWISLPTDTEFTIKIKVTTDRSIAGDFNFNGKISFVKDGERMSKDLVTENINLSPNKTEGDPVQSSSETISTEINVDSEKEKVDLNCSRTFDASQIVSEGTFLVELKIDKSNVSGVGKIIENVPEGFTAQEVEANGAIFSQKGTQVKFLWMTLPAEDSFTVSYKIAVDAGLSGNKVIDGKISYLDGSDTKQYLIDGTSISISNSTDPVTTLNSAQEKATSKTDEETDEETDKTESGKSELADKTTISKLETSENKQIETTESQEAESQEMKPKSSEQAILEKVSSNSQSGPKTDDNGNNLVPLGQEDTEIENLNVNYRVQICALRKEVSTNHFIKHHNVNEPIYKNMHEGWHKYTVGDFKKYMSASAHRKITKENYKINGTFVTAYNSGSRITVQEALMITKDEWESPIQ